MKTKFLLTLLSAATLLGAASASHAQSSKSQAGGLPALAEEVAALRAMVEDLQDQVGGGGDPYAGTYTVTTFETGIFGCTAVPPPGTPLIPPLNVLSFANLRPYLVSQATSSVSVRSATFEADSTGSALSLPAFTVFSQELRLSGVYQTNTDPQDPGIIAIASDGSMEADLDDALFTGQFSDDGSMFTGLVVGDSGSVSPACRDVWTVHVTGVRK